MINLIQGDCLEEMDILIEQGVKVDAIITDPPYGTTACNWDSVIPFAWYILEKNKVLYLNDALLMGYSFDYFEANKKSGMWERLNKLIKPNGAIVLFGSEPFSSALRMSNIKNYKYDWYWKKNKKTNFANAKKQPLRDIECVSVFCKKQSVYNPQGIMKIDKQVTRNKPKNETITAGENDGSLCGSYIQEFTGYPSHSIEFKCQSKTVHPTQKPVALMEYLIKTYTNENETVLDFTSGSGTTPVACINTGRNCIAIEKEEKYVDIEVERCQEALRIQNEKERR